MLVHAMIGISELWPILVIVLLLFGARKLPGLARAMGSSINQFKQGLAEEKDAPDQLGESTAGTKEGE
jgi:sec-independent protein translocase protein TatA